MGQNESTWTASELVYLFVDGEADDVQKTQLFGALANNSDLQAELADAIRINAAVRDETANAAPPAGVTATLFERAGIGVAAGSSSAPVVSGVVGGGTAAGVGLLMRKFGLPLVTGFLGAVLALFLVPEIGFFQENSGGRVAEQPRLASAQVESSRSTDNVQSPSTTGPRGERERGLKRGQQRFGMGQAVADRTLSEFSTSSVAQSSSDGFDRVELTTQPNGIASSDQSSVLFRPELLQVLPHQAINSASLISSTDREISSRVPRLTETSVSGSRFHFSTQIRGILGLETFPNRSLENGKSAPLENLALTAFWHPSEGHAFGVEVGRERHPLYVQNDPADDSGVIFLAINGPDRGSLDITITSDPNDLTGLGNGRNSQDLSNVGNVANTESGSTVASDTINGYRLEPIVEWVGLAYQFKAGAIDSRGAIRPYVQTVVGATQSGPIGKATLGVAWKPEDRISLGVGVEGTSLFYRRDGEWFSSRKVGATYSVQVEF
ncbi:MAG: hypothetical protein KDD67_04510 [Ignavibacteriae bacterium]|nr:hypothetical protein [Ignavibacteriota bacterium]MCB9214871.1 hypothetical protein [Ignavibacteria bacterium]